MVPEGRQLAVETTPMAQKTLSLTAVLGTALA
jgi:hypothetical protein